MSSSDPPEILQRFHDELSLVDIVARQIARTLRGRMDLDDLVSAGREGLLEASRRFDPERGVPFRSYANFRVRGAILDSVRRMGVVSRSAYQRLIALRAANAASEGALERAYAGSEISTGAPAEEVLDAHLATLVAAAAVAMAGESARGEAVDDFDLEKAYEREELLGKVRQELDELASEEAEIVRRHYFQGHRLEDIAADLNISKSWASRLHTRAMGRLSTRLGA